MCPRAKGKKQDRHCLRLCCAKRCEQACCEPAMNTFFACGISSSQPQVPSWLWVNLAWPHAKVQLCVHLGALVGPHSIPFPTPSPVRLALCFAEPSRANKNRLHHGHALPPAAPTRLHLAHSCPHLLTAANRPRAGAVPSPVCQSRSCPFRLQ